MRVFISYRRLDAIGSAGRIRDRLAAEFGANEVFFDIDAIPLGVDFRTHIDDRVADCDAVLVVIGRHWLETTDGQGRRRLDQPGDRVRLEIEAALRRDIPVIPLLVDGASIPHEDALPPSLAGLAFRNGIQVRHDPDFHTDMERLIRALSYSGAARTVAESSSARLAERSTPGSTMEANNPTVRRAAIWNHTVGGPTMKFLDARPIADVIEGIDGWTSVQTLTSAKGSVHRDVDIEVGIPRLWTAPQPVVPAIRFLDPDNHRDSRDDLWRRSRYADSVYTASMEDDWANELRLFLEDPQHGPALWAAGRAIEAVQQLDVEPTVEQVPDGSPDSEAEQRGEIAASDARSLPGPPASGHASQNGVVCPQICGLRISAGLPTTDRSRAIDAIQAVVEGAGWGFDIGDPPQTEADAPIVQFEFPTPGWGPKPEFYLYSSTDKVHNALVAARAGMSISMTWGSFEHHVCVHPFDGLPVSPWADDLRAFLDKHRRDLPAPTTAPSEPHGGPTIDRSWHESKSDWSDDRVQPALKSAGTAHGDPSSEPYVFISYASSDQHYVDELNRHLATAGIKTWVDRLGIGAGDEWFDLIEKKVDGCSAMIVVMSAAARRSAHVQREVQQAEDEGKAIFPLLLDGKRFMRLNHLQFEDSRGGAMPGDEFVEGLRRRMSDG